MQILQQAMEAIRSFRTYKRLPRRKKRIADELLGQFKGIIPEAKTSTEYIRELRQTLYGKIP